MNEDNGDTDCNLYAWNVFQILGKGARKAGNQRTNRGHPNYNTVEIGQNTVKSDLETWEDLLSLRLQWKTIN